MSPTYDYALFKFFNFEEFNFQELDKRSQESLFHISLSYPDLFKNLRKQHPDLISFFVSSFGYYPHYFLIDEDNCDWFIDKAARFNPELLNSLFFYSDWFSKDEDNIEVFVDYMIPSHQKSYRKRLMAESNTNYPVGELEKIISNIFQSCFKYQIKIDDVEGLKEVIDLNVSQFSNVDVIHKQLDSLLY